MYVFKIKSILITLLIIISVFSIAVFAKLPNSARTNQPDYQYSVLIDAGHGGIDGGSVGRKTKVVESELNLSYSFFLKQMLEEYGIKCYLTRESSEGLYDKNASNLKKSDMKKRKEIIDNIKPNLIVSIHMNSFGSESARGAQVFYKKDNDEGLLLANNIQRQLNKLLENTKNVNGKVGDYYMVNCTTLPAVLVECGYLSNQNDELLLQSDKYKTDVCYGIVCGIIDFLNR